MYYLSDYLFVTFHFITLIISSIDRGHYTGARRYEFYFRVVKTIFYEQARRVSKILFFKPSSNFLFII